MQRTYAIQVFVVLTERRSLILETTKEASDCHSTLQCGQARASTELIEAQGTTREMKPGKVAHQGAGSTRLVTQQNFRKNFR